jgi:hypothetical protein
LTYTDIIVNLIRQAEPGGFTLYRGRFSAAEGYLAEERIRDEYIQLGMQH